MNENISKAVDFAFSNNISEMGKEIEGALMQKVSDALAGKRIEVAQTLVQNEREEPVDDFEEEDFEESEELEEKLSVSDGAEKWIHDFVHSDNPKFEGKSKKERIQMALGAFYDAKKGTNEEIEDIQELSIDTLQSYVNKRQWDMGANEKMQKKLDTNLDRAEKKIKRKLKIGQ